MKKILLSTLVTVTLFTSGFAADTEKKFLKANHSLNKEFKNADKIEWSYKHGMMKASFLHNSKKTEAYYGTEGELVATCIIIEADEVPAMAKITLAKKFAGYKITEAISYQDANGEAYFVSAENETQKVIIKSKDGIATIFQKSIKK